MSYIKLNSLEDGPYDSVYNNVDIDLPAGDYDGEKSYVQLYCEVQSVQADPKNMNLPYLTGVNGENLYALSLIKNCSITSDIVGTFEDRRRNNVLMQTLKDYTQSEMEKDSSGDAIYNVSGNLRSQHTVVCRQIERSGTLVSKAVESPLKISLKDLFALGGMKYPGSKIGNTRIHLELQPEVVKVEDLCLFQTMLDGLVVLPYAKDDPVIFVECPSSRPCPFYNGMILSTPDDSAAKSENYTVQGISYDTTKSAYRLTLDQLALNDLATKTAMKYVAGVSASTGILGTTQTGTTNNFVINRVELVARKLMNPLPNIPQLTYRTFTTEEVNGFPAGNYTKMFYLEPECVNLFILFPGDDENNILSRRLGDMTYRLRLDNVDLTNRDVNIDEPLQLDRINMTFNNADIKVKNLTQFNKGNRADIAGTAINMIATPTPPTSGEKLLQVNITSSVDIPRMILYKQVLRSISL